MAHGSAQPIPAMAALAWHRGVSYSAFQPARAHACSQITAAVSLSPPLWGHLGSRPAGTMVNLQDLSGLPSSSLLRTASRHSLQLHKNKGSGQPCDLSIRAGSASWPILCCKCRVSEAEEPRRDTSRTCQGLIKEVEKEREMRTLSKVPAIHLVCKQDVCTLVDGLLDWDGSAIAHTLHVAVQPLKLDMLGLGLGPLIEPSVLQDILQVHAGPLSIADSSCEHHTPMLQPDRQFLRHVVASSFNMTHQARLDSHAGLMLMAAAMAHMAVVLDHSMLLLIHAEPSFCCSGSLADLEAHAEPSWCTWPDCTQRPSVHVAHHQRLYRMQKRVLATREASERFASFGQRLQGGWTLSANEMQYHLQQRCNDRHEWAEWGTFLKHNSIAPAAQTVPLMSLRLDISVRRLPAHWRVAEMVCRLNLVRRSFRDSSIVRRPSPSTRSCITTAVAGRSPQLLPPPARMSA